jgi:hypothetical protein
VWRSLQVRLISVLGARGQRQDETEEKCRFHRGL